jgi:hypothetical protein
VQKISGVSEHSIKAYNNGCNKKVLSFCEQTCYIIIELIAPCVMLNLRLSSY